MPWKIFSTQLLWFYSPVLTIVRNTGNQTLSCYVHWHGSMFGCFLNIFTEIPQYNNYVTKVYCGISNTHTSQVILHHHWSNYAKSIIFFVHTVTTSMYFWLYRKHSYINKEYLSVQGSLRIWHFKYIHWSKIWWFSFS